VFPRQFLALIERAQANLSESIAMAITHKELPEVHVSAQQERAARTIDGCTEVMQRDGQRDGLMCTVPMLRAGTFLVEETPPILFCFDSSHVGLSYTREAYPWLNVHAETNAVGLADMEPHLQQWMHMVKVRFEHLAVRDGGCGGFCANGGCFKCGPHVLTIAALQNASVLDFIEQAADNPRDGSKAWMQYLAVDEQHIAARMQVYEVLFVLDFISKTVNGFAMQEILRNAAASGRYTDLERKQIVQLYAMYVWHCVGVWKTHGVVFHHAQSVTDEYTCERKRFDAFAQEATTKLLHISQEHDRLYTFEDMELARKIIAGNDHRATKFSSYAVLLNKCNHVDAMRSSADVPNVRRCQTLRDNGDSVSPSPDDVLHSLEVIRDIQAGDFLVMRNEGGEGREMAGYKDDPAADAYFARNKDISVAALAAADDLGDFRGEVDLLQSNNNGWLPPYVCTMLGP
jgi:hypothetical protein